MFSTRMPCTLCDDSGWKVVETDGVRRVARCDCWRDGLTAKLLADAGIKRRYEHCDFSNFQIYPNERLMQAVDRARKFAEAFPVVEKGLFFIGPPGIGKTHLAVAALKQAIRHRGARGLFYEVPDLLKRIRSTYNPATRTAEMDVLRPVMSADLLVLDDLGAEKTSEWVAETLNLVVNHRYSEKLPTIFTSNFEEREDVSDPDSFLVRVGLRMHSRLYEMCEFLEFDGADYRHRPPNAGPDDLTALWKTQRRPARDTRPGASRQLKAQLRPGKDLGWSGGKAGH